jgi:putative hemolysin
MANSLYPISIAVLMMLLAGLFSGSETGIYRLSRLRLRLGVERRGWLFIVLSNIMQDSPGLLLSLLVGTNLAQYVATSMITGVFLQAVQSEYTAIFFTTLVITPILFVFSELIPKNVFLQRANQLTPVFAPLLWVTHRVLTWCGVVPVLRTASQVFGRLAGSTVATKTAVDSAQRHQVHALLRDTREEGLLTSVQTEIIDRIVNIPGLRLSTVMIPLGRVRSLDIRSDRAALLESLTQYPLTRWPVWEDSPTHIVGFVHIYDALIPGEPFDDLRNLVKPIPHLDAATPVIDAIHAMRRGEWEILLVTQTRRGGHDVPVGIVTMKDLVEELLGELAEW